MNKIEMKVHIDDLLKKLFFKGIEEQIIASGQTKQTVYDWFNAGVVTYEEIVEGKLSQVKKDIPKVIVLKIK